MIATFASRFASLPAAMPNIPSVVTSLAVLAAVSAAGNDIEPAIASLATFAPIAGRGEQCDLSLGGLRITLIDDAYNANLGSMAAALSLLGSTGDGRRKVAVLGEMRELGPDAAAYHTNLVPLIAGHRIDRVHAVGALYDDFWRSISSDQRGRRNHSVEELKDDFLPELRDGDVLLLKGSHGTSMHELVDWLKSIADPPVGHLRMEGAL